MPIRIFTIPFQDDTLTFHDDVVQQFCVNKRVYKIESKFFVRDHLPFWTVAVQYGTILSEEKPNLRVANRNNNTPDNRNNNLGFRLANTGLQRPVLPGL